MSDDYAGPGVPTFGPPICEAEQCQESKHLADYLVSNRQGGGIHVCAATMPELRDSMIHPIIEHLGRRS